MGSLLSGDQRRVAENYSDGNTGGRQSTVFNAHHVALPRKTKGSFIILLVDTELRCLVSVGAHGHELSW